MDIERIAESLYAAELDRALVCIWQAQALPAGKPCWPVAERTKLYL